MKALKTQLRKYYKYIDIPWTQPVLSANGTVGGNDFACFASSTYNTNYSVYKAFDGIISNLSSDNTWWCSSSKSGVQYIGFYNPDRIKVTNIRFYNQRAVSGDGVIASGTVQASFDNVNYIDLGTFSGNTFGTVYFDIDLSTNTNYYNYYRIVATGYSGRYATCGELEITATIQDIEESDSSDYDFYKDVDVYKTSKETIRNYYYSLEYTDVGTYTLNIPETGNYDIEMYGAGGGACGAMHSGYGYNVYGTSSGGSGAGFKGVVHLPHGTYTITIGAYGANSEFGGSSGATSASSGTATILQGIIEAGGGSGATANNGSSGTPGVGGTLTILDNSKIVSSVISSDGNNGQFKNVTGLSGFIANCPGGLSLYDDSQTGYGAGAGKIESDPAYNAQNGYFKISSSQKPVHYEDINKYKAAKF